METERKWTYKKLSSRDYMVYGEDGFAVANVFPKMATGTTFDDDARLIAAAPTLLAACKEMISADNWSARQRAYTTIRTAIEAATKEGS